MSIFVAGWLAAVVVVLPQAHPVGPRSAPEGFGREIACSVLPLLVAFQQPWHLSRHRSSLMTTSPVRGAEVWLALIAWIQNVLML